MDSSLGLVILLWKEPPWSRCLCIFPANNNAQLICAGHSICAWIGRCYLLCKHCLTAANRCEIVPPFSEKATHRLGESHSTEKIPKPELCLDRHRPSRTVWKCNPSRRMNGTSPYIEPYREIRDGASRLSPRVCFTVVPVFLHFKLTVHEGRTRAVTRTSPPL